MNMGFPLYILLFTFALLVLYFLLYLANLRLKFKCLDKILNFLAV